MRALLAALVDEHRSEFRRQPPLPRYGRELDLATPDDVYPLIRLPYGHWAGRYKRSADNAAHRTNSESASSGGYGPYKYGFYYPLATSDSLSSSQARAVALPRIGRYLSLHKSRPVKAAPIPRIGRQDATKDAKLYADQQLVDGAAGAA
jgi:hypothetical protein